MTVSLIALAALAAVQATPQQPLQLTCLGGGTANKRTAHTAYSHGSVMGNVGTTPVYGSGSGTTTVYGSRSQGFDDQVDVRLFSGDDRIRMPRTMLPVIHGGEAGWFRVKNVVADARTIRGTIVVGFLNNPKVFLDRVTGTISISGKSGNYAGQCEIIAASAPAKF